MDIEKRLIALERLVERLLCKHEPPAGPSLGGAAHGQPTQHYHDGDKWHLNFWQPKVIG